jgi:hypothetical protein
MMEVTVRKDKYGYVLWVGTNATHFSDYKKLLVKVSGIFGEEIGESK